MQHTLAILHSEEEYAYSLMNYMNEQKNFAFKVVAFTEKDVFLEYLQSHRIEILLFNDCMDSDELTKLKNISCYYLSDTLGQEEYKGKKAIFMYQSAEKIINMIHQFYTLEGNLLISTQGITKTRILTVCGFRNGSSQFNYSIQLSQVISQTRKVLLLSFQSFIPQRFFQQESNYNLSEAIYCLKMEEKNFAAKVSQWIQQYNTFYYLAGVEHYSDLNELTQEEVVHLLQELSSLGTYDVIVVDLPLTSGSLAALLPQSEIIYELLEQGQLNIQMREEFHRQLELKEGTAILSHIVEITGEEIVRNND